MTAGPDDDAELLTSPPGLRLDGRVAWITGASRGLGRALAFALAGAGAEVLLTARSEESLRATAETIRAAGGRAELAPGSIADPDDVQRACAVAHRAWGRLDVLVNNAGISPSFDRAERIDMDAFSEVLDVNVAGSLRCCRAALPLLEAAGGASIVNVSSVHGSSAHERLIAYASSKAALEMVTRTLALEWSDRRIRVNAVAPGYLTTEMTAGLRGSDRWRAALLERIPMGRFGDVTEVVGAVLFLAGDAAGYITGATLAVDGGWLAR
jgi:NAD(P)-dependent dehydrogenase (short-subunit alcohol dehydrogenase family)